MYILVIIYLITTPVSSTRISDREDRHITSIGEFKDRKSCLKAGNDIDYVTTRVRFLCVKK